MNKEDLVKICAAQFYVYALLNNKTNNSEKIIIKDAIKYAKVFADIYEEVISENN